MRRIEQSLKNTAVSIGIQVGTILLNFISRTILIRTMGEQYLGINGLFTNILSMLSLVEMGVGSALLYLMYKPMAERDEKKLCLLMRVYAKIYTIVGSAILVIGMGITPFLDFFMKETPDIQNLKLIYVLYILNMAMTYFFSYRASIINVAQKNYIVNWIKFKFIVVQYVLQIIVLIIFKNYILYYLCALIITIITNWAIYDKAGKMFPFIKERAKDGLGTKEKKELKKNISAMFFHKMGTFLVFGTDNLIISKFVGIVEVGLYSNYTMITNALSTAINLLFSSVTASVGNLVNHEENERTYSVFKNIFFANSWLVGSFSVGLIVLFNPFIELWLGTKFTFKWEIVAVIALNFYLTHIRLPANVFKESSGLFWNDRYKSVIESAVNIVFSLLLVEKLGILGVFIGTLISTVTVCFWVEPYILYKHYFKKTLLEYFKMFFAYFFVCVVSVIAIFLIVGLGGVNAIGGFVLRILLCAIVPNGMFIILFHKTDEYRYFVGIFCNLVKKVTLTVKQRKNR